MADIIEESKRLSIQDRVLENLDSAVRYVYNLRFNRQIGDNEIVISPWWTETRDREVSEFILLQGNDILQGAQASFVKKFKSMNWGITGPVRVAKRYQKILAQSNFGAGWADLIDKTVRTYTQSDKGAFWELIGEGDPDGEIEGAIIGVAYLDNQYCMLTGDIDYPVIYYNAKDEQYRRIHQSRVAHFVDSPSPNQLMNNTGFCSVSRVISSSEIMLKLHKYKKERLDDLPEAGLLMFNNVLPERWENAVAEGSSDRKRVGSRYWKPILTFFGLDPTQPAKADFTNFSKLPEQFNEFESTEMYLNTVALSFGVDVREFWPKPIGGLGTGTEVSVQHEKSTNKGIGEVIQMIEWVINWKILPETCEFAFDFIDDTQDLKSAEINETKIRGILRLWDVDAGREPVVSKAEIRQMLADNVVWFHEEFLEEDVTLFDNTIYSNDPTVPDPGLVEIVDVELGERCYVNNKGIAFRRRPANHILGSKLYIPYGEDESTNRLYKTPIDQ